MQLFSADPTILKKNIYFFYLRFYKNLVKMRKFAIRFLI